MNKRIKVSLNEGLTFLFVDKNSVFMIKKRSVCNIMVLTAKKVINSENNHALFLMIIVQN